MLADAYAETSDDFDMSTLVGSGAELTYLWNIEFSWEFTPGQIRHAHVSVTAAAYDEAVDNFRNLMGVPTTIIGVSRDYRQILEPKHILKGLQFRGVHVDGYHVSPLVEILE